MAAESTDQKIPGSQRPGGRKRRVAVFIAYVGEGYQVCKALQTLNIQLVSFEHDAMNIESDSCCMGLQGMRVTA